MDFMGYILDEATVLIPVLYIIGMALKQSKKIKDEYIPIILVAISIIVCIGLLGFNVKSVTQGVLIAGVTVFGNQLVKQLTNKKEGEE